MGRPLQPCGTIAAHRRHLRHGEAPCDACAKAWADWHREYLANAPEVRARARAWGRAHQRALRRLGAAHPDELNELLADELERRAS